MGRVGQITIVAGNALDDSALEAVLSPADAVLNMVGILAESGAQKFGALQAELPQRIGRLAARHGHHAFVHLSAIGADLGSASRYARTKAAGEAGLKAAFPKAVILRPSVFWPATVSSTDLLRWRKSPRPCRCQAAGICRCSLFMLRTWHQLSLLGWVLANLSQTLKDVFMNWWA